MTSLDHTLALTPDGEGVFHARSSSDYVAIPGSMFGGWTAALIIKAITSDPRASGVPVSLNVNYISRVSPDTELIVTTQRLGGTRSLATWRVDVAPVGKDVVTTATVIMGNRGDTRAFVDPSIKMPEAPAPESVEIAHPPSAFGRRTDFRPVYGYPPFNRGDTRSVQWLREMTGRAVDHVLLAYLSDAYPPRIMFVSGEPQPSPTLALSIYYYATADELAAIGDDFILTEAIGTRGAQSVIGSQLRMWSKQGALLATSEQVCWFR